MAEIVASGSWWTLDSDGLLDIFREGAMPDYDYFHNSKAPWYEQCSRIQTVIMRNSLTRIGIYAFYYCTNLTSVTIPGSVASIGTNAFHSCVALRNITIPDSVISIGGGAFQECAALSSITMPDSVTSIGGFAFRHCRALRSIAMPDGVPFIEICTFAGCTNLTHVTILGSVTSIWLSAFEGCENLRHVYYRGYEYDWQGVDINSENESLSRAIIHYVPPVLHVGGTLRNGRISGEQFAFAPGDYEELSYVQSASMDGDEVQSDKLYAELRVTGNPEAWLSGWAGVSRMVPVWFTRYGQIDGHNTVSVIERREKYSQTT